MAFLPYLSQCRGERGQLERFSRKSSFLENNIHSGNNAYFVRRPHGCVTNAANKNGTLVDSSGDNPMRRCQLEVFQLTPSVGLVGTWGGVSWNIASGC